MASLEDENAKLRDENEQLMEQIAFRQPSAVERDMQEVMRINNELKAEIERLLAALEEIAADSVEAFNPLRELARKALGEQCYPKENPRYGTARAKSVL